MLQARNTARVEGQCRELDGSVAQCTADVHWRCTDYKQFPAAVSSLQQDQLSIFIDCYCSFSFFLFF